MIDFVVVDERLRKLVTDTRAYRGTGVGTDHYLVVSQISGLFKGWRHRPSVPVTSLKRIKVEKLEEPEVKEKYVRKATDKIGDVKDKECWKLDDLWDLCKNSMVEASSEECGVTTRKINNKRREWWDNEVRKAVKEKKNAWINLATVQNARCVDNIKVERMKEIYKDLKKKVKAIVERKKNEVKVRFENKFSGHFRSNLKLFWNMVRKARRNTDSKLSVVRDENGMIMTDERDVLERWKQHFESLFERDQASTKTVDGGNYERILELEISTEEIMKAMKSMKMGKAAGFDRVSAEMLRAGGGVVVSLLCLLFNVCWRDGRVPEDWCKAVIVPLYKGRGSSQDCKNYRGISLLSVVGKLYAKILIERVVQKTEGKMWDVQAGFRKGMGCVDQIFSLRNIAEKFLAKNRKVFCTFVDLEKAYDKVERDDLWSTLSVYGVDGNLIRALKSLYDGSSACVRINGAYSDWFAIGKGVRQGCVASPWLFNLFMDSCLDDLKDCGWGLRLGELLVKCLLYADDQVLLAESAEEMQKMVTLVNESFSKRGMKINVSKTKVMVLERDEKVTECRIMIGDEKVEQVNEFVYLGCVFTRDGKYEEDIERRVKLGNQVNGALHSLMHNRNLSNKARLAIHEGVLIPTLTYGSECWVWQKKNESRLNAVEMRSLRNMCGLRLVDRVRNSVIREKCGLKEDVVMKVRKGMLRWFGHIERMSESRVTKGIYKSKLAGVVPKGRPRRTFEDQIREVLEIGQVRSTHNRRQCMRRCMTVDEAREVCQDRGRWRDVISAYPSGIQA